MTVNAPAWLTASPIAHRGWHSAAAGRVENTLGAARAAIEKGFAIECDVQITADGEAIVFHDGTLDRLTRARGEVQNYPLADLRRTRYQGCDETISTLSDLLDEIGNRTPLVCEIKSQFRSDMRLAARVLEVAAAYQGPLALKSFDPEVIAYLRSRGAGLPLGLVAEARYDDPYFAEMSASLKTSCEALLHFPDSRPDFLSWSVADLPHAVPSLFRSALQRPVMVWTVRTPAQKAAAALYADQIVFEGDA